MELKLSSDDDEQLRALTKRIRDETAGLIGWWRLGRLLLKIGQLDKAEELYNALLAQASNEDDRAHYYNRLGLVKYDRHDYKRAIWYRKKAIEIKRRTLASDDPLLSILYSNIGVLYGETGEYAKAFSFYEKTIEIEEKTLSPDNPALATSYNNIGSVCQNMEEYRKALLYLEHAQDILERSLPPNHHKIQDGRAVIDLVRRSL